MITANDLKTKGARVIDERLVMGEEEVITVRGKKKYVVVHMERYEYLRACELESIYQEVMEDVNKGDYTTSIEEHLQEIKDAIGEKEV